MERNHLQLNLDKTKMVVIGKPHVIKSVGKLEVQVRDIKISSSESCECLGLLIESLRYKFGVEVYRVYRTL